MAENSSSQRLQRAQGHEPDIDRAQRQALWTLIVVGLAMWCYVLLELGALFREQPAWSPTNAERLAVVDKSYSQHGIKLRLHAPSGVAEVWKSPQGPRHFWERHYQRVPFRIIESDAKKNLDILVDYKFSPPGALGLGAEWCLAIKSKDGYWVSMSPYFPEEPDLTDEEWNELIEKSRPVAADE